MECVGAGLRESLSPHPRLPVRVRRTPGFDKPVRAARAVDPFQSVRFLQGHPWLNASGLVFRMSEAAFRELRQTATGTVHPVNAVVPRHDCAGTAEYRRSR